MINVCIDTVLAMEFAHVLMSSCVIQCSYTANYAGYKILFFVVVCEIIKLHNCMRKVAMTLLKYTFTQLNYL